jgi:anti-sigma B factor antagonist
MSVLSASSLGSEYFQVHRRGDIMIVIPSPEIEQLPTSITDTAAQVVLAPLKARPATNVIVDLSRVHFFGSEFISFLLRCHVIVKKEACEMVLAGVSDRIRELLRQTALDTLWAIYDSRAQALEALGGSE